MLSFTGADSPAARLPTLKYTVLVPLPGDKVKLGAVEYVRQAAPANVEDSLAL
jgi:hypothetical protein